MYRDLQEVNWWDGLKRYIAEFVAKCPNCQKLMVEHQRLGGLTQVMDEPTWKCEDINMDFVVGLPRIRKQNDSIWIIMDKLTKSAHFMPIKSNYSAEEYARLYLNDIVSFHRPLSIITDRGSQFASRFWVSFQKGIGTQVKLSTSFTINWMDRRYAQ